MALDIAGDSVALCAAGVETRLDMLAASAIATYSSEVTLYVDVCANAMIDAFPVTVESLSAFGSVLKCAGHRSGTCRLSAVLSCNKLLGHSASPKVTDCRNKLGGSLRRGLGDNFQMQPVGIDMLQEMADALASPPSRRPPSDFDRLVFRLSVVGCFFMLRSDTLLRMRHSHVRLQPGAFVGIMLSKDKTNPEERTTRRRLTCVCASSQLGADEVVCPCCCIQRLVRDSPPHRSATTSTSPELSCGLKAKRLGHDGFLKGLRDLVKRAGHALRDASGRNLIGKHSLRRGGAQSLKKAGWSVDMIQMWGRWDSSAVFLYIMDSAYEARWPEVAPAMLGSCSSQHCPGAKDPQNSQIAHCRRNLPCKGDAVSIYSDADALWLRRVVISTPSCPSSSLSADYFLVEFRSLAGGDNHTKPAHLAHLGLDALWVLLGRQH